MSPSEGHRDRLRAFAPIGVGLLVIGFLVARGRLWAAVVLVVVLVGVAQARSLSPRFDRRFVAGMHRFAQGLAHAVGWVLLGVTFVLVFLPAAAFGLLFRRRDLGRPRGLPAEGWVPRTALQPSGSTRRRFGAEPVRVPGTRMPRLLLALAVLAGAVIIDVTAGAILTGTGLLPPQDRGDLVVTIDQATSQSTQSPAIVDEPWAAQFGEDMGAFGLEPDPYVPYLVRGHHEFRSPTINTTDRERVSYRPEVPDGVGPLRIAFFGGSVMFGVADRDEHTIPSAFARVAEEHGVPVEVHNYGFPAWVSWQEYQYLERLLAAGETYDAVVFLDGFNEFEVQRSGYSPDPTHNGVGAFQEMLQEFYGEHLTEPGFFDGLEELVSSYRRNSAIWRLTDELAGNEVPLPGSGAIPPSTPEEQTDAALDVYDRSTGLITAMAEGSAMPAFFFWQPRLAGWPDAVTDRLAPSVTDLTDVFQGQEDDVYIDDVHTNELGARLIAEAMWAEAGPALARQAGAS